MANRGGWRWQGIAHGPELLLIDEPGAGMNPKEIGALAMTIKEIKERFGLTIIMIEHHMDLIMGISDRIMVMDFGKKVMEGNPAEVKKDKGVIEAYLGESL
jgi:branched-chain amino acid transport system ATP-binding protein